MKLINNSMSESILTSAPPRGSIVKVPLIPKILISPSPQEAQPGAKMLIITPVIVELDLNFSCLLITYTAIAMSTPDNKLVIIESVTIQGAMVENEPYMMNQIVFNENEDMITCICINIIVKQ